MEPVKWFDRKFDFDFKENNFPIIQKRLEKTPQRLVRLIKLVPVEFVLICRRT
jgi:hypothetical protein